MGFGINSPYFLNNLQCAIETEPGRQLTVSVEVDSDLHYEICLIPNHEDTQVLTKLSLESIINHSLLSSEKDGAGSFTIETTCSHYILVINAFKQYEGQLKINVALFGQESSKESVLSI